MKLFLITLFILNVLIICTYLVLSYFKLAYISDMNFTCLILFGISTNIVIGELILKHNAIYGQKNKDATK
jgi:pilus assembly protein TadC